MKRLIALILALAMSLALAACGGEPSTTDSNGAASSAVSSAEVSSNTEELAPEEEEEEVVTISGSHAGVVMDQLKKNYGFPVPPAMTENGITTWDAISDDHKYSYLMNGASGGSEISYAQFDALRDDSDALGYLSFCATVPYEGSDAKAAKAFIEENIEGDALAQTTIGGADFYLRPIGLGSQLIIVPTGIDP